MGAFCSNPIILPVIITKEPLPAKEGAQEAIDTPPAAEVGMIEIVGSEVVSILTEATAATAATDATAATAAVPESSDPTTIPTVISNPVAAPNTGLAAAPLYASQINSSPKLTVV